MSSLESGIVLVNQPFCPARERPVPRLRIKSGSNLKQPFRSRLRRRKAYHAKRTTMKVGAKTVVSG